MLLAEHSIAGAVIANKRHAQQQARTKHSVGSADKRRERTPGFLTTSSCEKKHRKIDRSTFGPVRPRSRTIAYSEAYRLENPRSSDIPPINRGFYKTIRVYVPLEKVEFHHLGVDVTIRST